ncbi:MAG: DUF444 family protein [Myxococcales bacterium]|nr:MAG: DUF444 family protein [Myxococcales bacterium]
MAMSRVLSIDKDLNRFRQIVRGRIKQDLRKYITKGEMIGRKGKDTVTIPVPQIEIPRFRFGDRQQGGVGQGEGEEGDPLSSGEEGEGGGRGEAGDKPGEHSLEVEISLQELAQILGEELQLPRIQPKGADKIRYTVDKYRGIRRVGPESLRHFKRTYREALKRQIALGTYQPVRPNIIPVREDRRYRSWKTIPEPQYNAVIIYMMDVSGSMGDEQKEMVRIESFWIDTWLRSQYKGIESRYVIHDATAREVDRDTFFRTKESGGTVISTAYKVALDILAANYPLEDWNVYMFQFSDGDNWSNDDTQLCVELLQTKLLPIVNLFGYGQVRSFFGSGQFILDLRRSLSGLENLVLSEIPDKDAIYDSIKDFLGKGK